MVTGGSASGKSEFAENMAVSLNKSNLIYIATMQPYDEECLERIKKHREMRKDKGFETIECYENLKAVSLEGKPTVLLECMSNLLANIMFSENRQLEKSDISNEIMAGIHQLVDKSDNVIVVTNEVFSDNGSVYGETMDYIKCLGIVNTQIAKAASEVYEVVCKIPITIKNESQTQYMANAINS
jgi:adenosylcobinamide kinase / adenosylcobinamide-phosphate guanylyltransferase